MEKVHPFQATMEKILLVGAPVGVKEFPRTPGHAINQIKWARGGTTFTYKPGRYCCSHERPEPEDCSQSPAPNALTGLFAWDAAGGSIIPVEGVDVRQESVEIYAQIRVGWSSAPKGILAFALQYPPGINESVWFGGVDEIPELPVREIGDESDWKLVWILKFDRCRQALNSKNIIWTKQNQFGKYTFSPKSITTIRLV